MYNAIQGVEIGGERAIVLFWIDYEFCKTLNGVRWVF